jgi:hypothetical protein
MGCSKHKCVHTQVFVVTGAYKSRHVNTEEVSTTGYFQGILSGHSDGNNIVDSLRQIG